MRRAWLLGLAVAAGSASAADPYYPGAAEDPHVRAARFLGEDKQYFSAVSELLKVQKSGGDEFEASPDYWAALAEYYLSFGMRDRSEAIYRTIAGAATDPQVAGRAKLRLATFEYERGYLDEARASLLRDRENLPKELLPNWRDLYSRVLLAQGRYNEAASILEKVDSVDDPQGFMRYNLGVALISDGRASQGRTVLERVGRIDGKTQEIMALRDKANTTLGWHFLQSQLGGSAKPVLQRVRSEGIYSNRALLGLGWAEVAGEGKRQVRARTGSAEDINDPFRTFSALGVLLRRGYLDDPYDRAGIRTFRRSGMAKDEDDGLRRALVAWVELVDRDPQDPSVHEAWLAIPFALDKLGAHTQAEQFYEQAADRLETARQRTADAIQQIRSGRMVETIIRRDADAETGWTWELTDLPDAPETYYLQTLIAEHPFAEGLKNYRDVRLMMKTVNGWKSRISEMDAALRTQGGRPTMDPRVATARAKRNWKKPKDDLHLGLIEEVQLAAPGSFTAPSPTLTMTPPRLKLSEIPSSFDGPYERLQSLKKRVATLEPALQKAAGESARQLAKMAVDELEAQKNQIEKYLVEVRFSLARLYDHALPEADQDEFEVDKSGKPLAPKKLTHGEFEIDKGKPLEGQLRKRKPASSADEYEVK